MARKPSDAGRVSRAAGASFNEQAFLDGVFNNEYLLVIGSGVILDRTQKQFISSDGDINRYIVEEINKDRRADRAGFEGYHSFTEVYRGTAPDEQDPIHRLLTDDLDYLTSDMSPELVKLIKTRQFRFVLTTTIDGYLEVLMREVWGDELRVVNIENDMDLRDFRIALENSRSGRTNKIPYIQPTLFYVFGKAIKNQVVPRGFVETDTDAIKIIEKWLKLDSGKDLIIPFLKSKHILSLGCRFGDGDDWYFRFFWYILTRGFGNEGRVGNPLTTDNLVRVFDPNEESDLRLKRYLSRIGVCLHDDVWEFMTRIYNMLTPTPGEDGPLHRYVLENRREKGIFISYKHEDMLVAGSLFSMLAREKNYNVWFDENDTKGGDPFEEVIKSAISRAQVFIAVLTPNVEADVNEKGENLDDFYTKEWEWAFWNKELTVIPLILGKSRAGENKSLQVLFNRTGREVSAVEWNPTDGNAGYEKLLEAINKHLNL